MEAGEVDSRFRYQSGQTGNIVERLEVEVDVKIQRTAKALNQRDRAGLSRFV